MGSVARAIVQSDVTKAQLTSNTQSAVQRGVFGAPTFMIGDELIWGQDRIDLVMDLASGWWPSKSRDQQMHDKGAIVRKPASKL